MKVKVLLVLSLIAAASIFNSLSAEKIYHEKIVGLRAGYTTRNNTASAGLYFSYLFSKHFRVSPKLDYAFRHNATDAFSMNFDTEYPIYLNSTRSVIFYPIAGLNYTNFTTKSQLNDDDSNDSSFRTNRFGLNLGAGIEYRPTSTLRLALESKCQLMKNYTGGWFTLSIGYIF